jgi:hypothetical protein
VLVLDDDLLMSASAISRLFEIRAQYDLWLVQPAFVPHGKISHSITEMRRATILRYTNFVEVGCPLFRKDKLDRFMQAYDPSLVGWGVDSWFLQVLGPKLEGKVAIVDAVTCRNPYDHAKGGQREIDKLQSKADRIAAWERIRVEHHLEDQTNDIVEYGGLLRPRVSRIASAIRWLVFKGAAMLQRVARRCYRLSLRTGLTRAHRASPKHAKASVQDHESDRR